MKWYITKYAQSGGQYELLTFLDPQPYEVAKFQHSKMSNDWHLECRLGSLEPLRRYELPKRERYSHIPEYALSQFNADKDAKKILSQLSRISTVPTLKKYLEELLRLKPLLTKPQYEVLFTAYSNNPYVKRMTYNLYN